MSERTVSKRVQIEHDEYLSVIAMSAEAAKRFFGRTDDPVDLGPAPQPERHKKGARVWGFK
jgi:hypothetical protein